MEYARKREGLRWITLSVFFDRKNKKLLKNMIVVQEYILGVKYDQSYVIMAGRLQL